MYAVLLIIIVIQCLVSVSRTSQPDSLDPRKSEMTRSIEIHHLNTSSIEAMLPFYQYFRYGWKANIDIEGDQGHWNTPVLRSSFEFPYDVASMPFAHKYSSLFTVWNEIQEQIGRRPLLNVYLNGYTYGTDGYAHTDIDVHFKNGTHDVTILLYLNTKWDKNWGGETVFFDSNDDIIRAVLPKFGRFVVFPSATMHGARPLSRSCPVLRHVLVFKTMHQSAVSEAVSFLLERTNAIAHNGGKSFFEHLYKTMLALETDKQPKYIVAAGLYHAVYGTSFFSFSNKDFNRTIVRRLIGDRAEELVFLFSTMKNRTQTLLRETVIHQKDLIRIEIANLGEQNANGVYTRQIRALKSRLGKV
jgi:SM-20-related protein